MPIYEYQCSKCSHQFEMIRGIFDRGGKIVCPKCGDPKPQQVVSSFSCGGSRVSETGAGPACSPKPRRFS